MNFEWTNILIGNLVGIFLFFPIILLIHEYGHAVFAKLLGAKTIKIQLGSGKKCFRISNITVRKFYMFGGLCTWGGLRKNSKISRFFVFFGGVLFNMLSLLILYLLFRLHMFEWGFLHHVFVSYTLFAIVLTLMPFQYKYNGIELESDGKQILNLFRKE